MCDSIIVENPSYQKFFSFDEFLPHNDVFEESVLSVMAHSILAIQHIFKKHKLRVCIEVVIDNAGTLKPKPHELENKEIVGAVLDSNFCYTRGEETVIAEIRLQKNATPELARVAIAHELGHLLHSLSQYCVKTSEYQHEADALFSTSTLGPLTRKAKIEQYIHDQILKNAGTIWPNDDSNEKIEELCHNFAYNLCKLHDEFNRSPSALKTLNHFVDGFFNFFSACDMSDSSKWHPTMIPNADRRFYSKRRVLQMKNNLS